MTRFVDFLWLTIRTIAVTSLYAVIGGLILATANAAEGHWLLQFILFAAFFAVTWIMYRRDRG